MIYGKAEKLLLPKAQAVAKSNRVKNSLSYVRLVEFEAKYFLFVGRGLSNNCHLLFIGCRRWDQLIEDIALNDIQKDIETALVEQASLFSSKRANHVRVLS